MKVAERIQGIIEGIPEGRIFGYDALGLDKRQYAAATKAVERLVIKGILQRYSKGIFFRPKKTIFGEIGPSESEILGRYLYNKGKQVAYITGSALYHRMGLTTQVPSVLQIASKGERIRINNGTVQARPAKSYVDVSADNVSQLELLDALKDFRQIPDLDRSVAISVLSARLKQMSTDELGRLSGYAQAYPPRVGALLGALLDFCGQKNLADKISSYLNPLTKFRLGIQPGELPTAPRWNIE
jgi:hypothetical protein